MTAANEGPITCPCCQSVAGLFSISHIVNADSQCSNCGCTWDSANRRAQTAYTRKAPWPDFAGNDIYEGDVIQHPVSSERGTVIFLGDEAEASDQWRVAYGKRGELNRLCLQIGDKGQAAVVSAQPTEAVDEAKEREAFEKFYTGAKRYRSVLGYHSPYAERWDGWMAAIEARARGGN